MAIALNSCDAIVLGAGVSGLTAAAILSRQGLSVCLVDGYPEPGGNHISHDFGEYTFDMGAIFFWSSGAIFRLFPATLEVCVPVDYRVERIAPGGAIRPYPFDMRNELYTRSCGYLLTVLADIARSRLAPRRRDSALDFCRYYLGERVLEDSGLLTYLERFYGIPADEISYAFAEARMDWVSNKASLRRGLRRWMTMPLGQDRQSPAPHCLARPRSGFGTMYRLALSQLEMQGVRAWLGARPQAARRTPQGFEIEHAGGRCRASRLISTFPVAMTARLFGLPVEELPESTTMLTLCCRFHGRRNFDGVILYNFERAGAWKRLTMHSDYYQPVAGWEFFSVEVTSRGDAPDATVLFDDFRRTTQSAGLFDGKLELVGSFSTAFAYPVYDLAAERKREGLLRALAAQRIETLGRQGLFNYIPSSDLAVGLVEQALKAEAGQAAPEGRRRGKRGVERPTAPAP